jgi:hypothetical protein
MGNSAAAIRLSGTVATLALVCISAFTAPAENLLANPGFEDLAGDRPARWDVFVQPKPGAEAAISDIAHGGAYSIRLHTPTPYEKEPVNNWSQNLIADFGGQTLEISGFIRVQEAKEAALWIQLWRKRPWGVLGAHSTSVDSPVYGTAEWQEVRMSVEVPKGTDFVTIRCVLLGTGSAWFDDLSVTRVEAGAKDTPATPAKSASAQEDVAAPAPGAPVPEAPAAPAAGPAADKVVPMVNQLESEVRRLRDANVILTDTLQQIQQVNQALLDEMLSVQEELRQLKAEQAAASAPPLDPAKPRVPPLVPLSESQESTAP